MLNCHLKVHQKLHYTYYQSKGKFSRESNLNQHLLKHHTLKPIVLVRDVISLHTIELKRLRYQTSDFGVFKTRTFHSEKHEESSLVIF